MPVIKRADSYRWSVKHMVEIRDAVPQFLAFDVQFKALPQSKVSELMADAIDGKLGNERFVDSTMAGWHDMKRADGSTWDFSTAAVLELAEMYPGMTATLSRAWTESVTGGAARKN